MTKTTIGDVLLEFKRRSGLSLPEIARAAGYAGASSVQAFFRADYDPASLPFHIGEKLEKALVGHGQPPITQDEFLNLFWGERGEGLLLGKLTAPDNPDLDLPLYSIDLALEQPIGGLELHEVSEWDGSMTRRPRALIGNKKAYAVYIAGSSMEPRYRPGDPIFVDPSKPPAPGDDVIVNLKGMRTYDAGRFVFSWRQIAIKTLVERSSAEIVVEQYSPSHRTSISTDKIEILHRIVPYREAVT